jgi:dihydroorotase
MYDVIVANGHVLDPAQGIDGRMDVAVSGGRIARVAPSIAASEAAQVIDASGAGRYVVPGLIDLHAHVAYGATTAGVGMACCDPDEIGVQSGVTTVVDGGSVGIANVGVFPVHILPRAKTRVVCYLNVGSFAHTTRVPADVNALADIDLAGIEACVANNPGLVAGMKLRAVGSVVRESGEAVIRAAQAAARAAGVPLMVHIGDASAGEAGQARMTDLTRFLLEELDAGDILTHLCTPNPGGVGRAPELLEPLAHAARDRHVVLDAALGRGNFGYQIAREQFERGLFPDSISSDLTGMGLTFHSLMECMAKFMAVGYSLSDVVRMTTINPARALGLDATIGSLREGLEADITIMDVVEDDFVFTDTTNATFHGGYGMAPVHTLKDGALHAPRWGTHPWGWLPRSASMAEKVGAS